MKGEERCNERYYIYYRSTGAKEGVMSWEFPGNGRLQWRSYHFGRPQLQL